MRRRPPHRSLPGLTCPAAAILFATVLGTQVSTTQTIAGAIVGVVKWGVAGRIVWAWVLTIPLAGLVAAGSYLAIMAIR